jgi:hypothetical protein
MARSVIYIGDQQPSFPTIVTDVNGNVVNLTGYSGVTFALRVAYEPTTNVFENAGTIVSPTLGSIQYTLGSTDLSGLTAGVYAAQWTLLDASSKPQHVDAGEFELRVAF